MTSIRDNIGDRPKHSFKVNYYDQTLDHFNYRPGSYATFKQKYVILSKYWGGRNLSAPIFVYLGAETSLSYYDNGFMEDNAEQFNALLVYIEHRYYGDSIPFGSREEAYRNSSTLGYFNSAQAIADYADILIHVKRKLHAQASPIIAVGGSYGGTLASSAPILYFDDVTPNDGYYAVASRDFQEESQSCYETIKRSWNEIVRIASEPDGLSILSQKFKTCSLDDIYSRAAQYNPSDVTLLCQASPPPPLVTHHVFVIHLVMILKAGVGRVLENLSKTLVAITTKEGAHCWDIDDSFPTDPEWLVKQREEEVKAIKGWLNKYYYDLQSSKLF
uniref:Lysosomal Pro-X carboxypeptidase n=1 Tax=Kalanchoe fedtschenkoi TaxID=63787 RepID=A0A7N0UNQ7_KALFE